MKRLMANRKQKQAILIALAAPLMFSPAPLMAATGTSEPVAAIAQQAQTIVSVQRINPTTVDVVFSNNQRMTFDFYGDNIFRMFQDNNGGILRDPEAKPEARILVDNPRRPVSKLDIQEYVLSRKFIHIGRMMSISQSPGRLKSFPLRINATG